MPDTTRKVPKPSQITVAPPIQHIPAHRGEVWMVCADENHVPVGAEIWSNRPAVVVSNNILNRSSQAVMVVYLSSSASKTASPTHVVLEPIGTATRSVALCEQIHTVDRSRLSQKLGAVSETELDAISHAMHLSTGMGKSTDGRNVFYKWDMTVRKHGIELPQSNDPVSRDEYVASLEKQLALVTRQRDAYHALHLTGHETQELAA